MRAWKIDTLHGLFAVDISKTIWNGREMAVVSLRRPEVAGGMKQSLVPMKRAMRRVFWIVDAVVKRLTETEMVG